MGLDWMGLDGILLRTLVQLEHLAVLTTRAPSGANKANMSADVRSGFALRSNSFLNDDELNAGLEFCVINNHMMNKLASLEDALTLNPVNLL